MLASRFPTASEIPVSEKNEQDSPVNEARDYRVETRVVHSGGSDPRVVSGPVYHASTVLFSDYQTFRQREAAPLDRQHLYYGRMGTPTTRALEDALCALDNSAGAVLTPSGVASITDILSCFLEPGDHLLMVDSVYGPTRNFCRGALAARGVRTSFYDPLAGAEIAGLLRENTRLIFMESPGSATFEVQDVPAIVAVAREQGILTAIDNTWATPLLFNPLDKGVDLAMQSGTKYLNGHADCLFGVTTTRDPALYKRLQHYTLSTGSHLAPDDANLALRGLRTLPVRLRAHDAGAREVAGWLQGQGRVRRLLHPAWPSCPGHAIFQRDFCGANGLFGMLLEVGDEQGLQRFVDRLRLFGIGFSWGGFESLCLPMDRKRECPSLDIASDEALLRLHIGLEHPEDLIADLQRGFAAI
ncbi:MAG: cystathionine beta-lyase [Halieaceae bacterium]|jgi:cystathionine beta-lyase